MDDDHARELFDFLLGKIPERVYFKDTASRFIGVSCAMAEFLGERDPKCLIGETDSAYLSREHADEALEDGRKIMRDGQPIINKVEKETLAGSQINWSITTKMPLRDSHGRIFQSKIHPSLYYLTVCVSSKRVAIREVTAEN